MIIEANSKAGTVFMVGGFPPPVHGMSQVNQFVRGELLKRGAVVTTFDVAPSALGGGMDIRMGRLFRVAKTICRFMVSAMRHRGTVYIGVSGGFGQIYDCLFVLIARISGLKVVLHHHSFAYLWHASPVPRLLFFLAGRDAINIVLCDFMGKLLRGTYGDTCATKVLSNAFAVGKRGDAVIPRPLTTVGYLGNIAYDKGISDFLDVAYAMAKSGVKFVIAGPFQDRKVELDVMARIADLKGVHYLGPVYGAAKEEFYGSIDVLLFPTRYRNEAEPLTVLEALSRGIPVIARGLGCIPSMLESCAGCVTEKSKDFKAHTVSLLRDWLDDREKYQLAAEHVLKQFHKLHAGSVLHYESFLTSLASGCLDDVSVDTTAT